MKGIILAGGSGTRLHPATKVTVKQLLPVYDKPMIYYPLSVLMLAGIRDILIISTPADISSFEKLFGDGGHLGLRVSYAQQKEPRGIAEAFIIGEEFIGDDSVCLVLGDNIFYGQDLTKTLREALSELSGAMVFGYPVKNPSEFGILELDGDGNVICIEEKPTLPKSEYAVTGLYFYDSGVVELAKKIEPSERGELEITTLNNEYIKRGKLRVKLLGRGMAWFDTGSADALLEAGAFIGTVQRRQGYYISCIEEIAWRRGFITDEELYSLGVQMRNSEYGKYILGLVGER